MLFLSYRLGCEKGFQRSEDLLTSNAEKSGVCKQLRQFLVGRYLLVSSSTNAAAWTTKDYPRFQKHCIQPSGNKINQYMCYSTSCFQDVCTQYSILGRHSDFNEAHSNHVKARCRSHHYIIIERSDDLSIIRTLKVVSNYPNALSLLSIKI